jgi:hypothetical protein
MPSSSIAWNAATHKFIASIAFRKLTKTQRMQIADAIRNHPRFVEDFNRKMPEEISSGNAEMQAEWIFQQASIWPDLARGFNDEDKKKYHRSVWHYLDRPQFLTEADRNELEGQLRINSELTPPSTLADDMNTIQVIRFTRTKIADSATAPVDKGLYLAWLFHTVGDVHQPMHSTAMFSQKLFPDGDQGGNLIPTVQERNLHALWDNLPGSDMSFADCRNRAIQHLADPTILAFGEPAGKCLDELNWFEESFQSATEQAYAPELLVHLKRIADSSVATPVPPMDFSPEYLKKSGEVARRRAIVAGFRLGEVLNLVCPN